MRKQILQRRTIALLLTTVMGASLSIVATNSATAACAPVKATGKTVGSISIGSLTMPIKAFNYPAGGVMEPQKTTTVAGLSERHMPLSSTVGSSVIVWHRDFNGCVNPLNIFMEKSAGTKFTLTDELGVKKSYRLDKVGVISKGNYKQSWFDLIGPRQVVMFTCTGVFKSGHYEKNMVFVATPL